MAMPPYEEYKANHAVHTPRRWSIRANQGRNDLSRGCFRGGGQRISVLPAAGFQKGRGLAIGERLRMVLNHPCLSDHRFSHSPSMAFPLAGCFVSSILLKLRHLRGFSVPQYSHAEKAQKAVSDASPTTFPPFFSV